MIVGRGSEHRLQLRFVDLSNVFPRRPITSCRGAYIF